MTDKHSINVTINDEDYTSDVEARMLLSDFIRHELGLTGTHVGCEHGVCGACTVILNGRSVRSCLMFAVQAHEQQLNTVEGMSVSENDLHPLQEAFREAHGLQCGFCTPGILMSLIPFLEDNPCPSEEEIRSAISGNLCRCTGYDKIIRAVLKAGKVMRSA